MKGVNAMQALAAPLRIVFAALVFLAIAMIGYPAATQAQSVNPTKSAVSEQQLLQQSKTIRGRAVSWTPKHERY
jgi:hypothetical protein